jgi:hypothetical protein
MATSVFAGRVVEGRSKLGGFPSCGFLCGREHPEVSINSGCVGILVHSFLDFNLQIPARAALFYALCALVAAPARQESQRRRVVRRHSLIVEPMRDNIRL